MPEGRPTPYKYFPRRKVDLSVTFGEPVLEADVKAALKVRIFRNENEDPLPVTDRRIEDERNSGQLTRSGWLGESRTSSCSSEGKLEQQAHEIARVRSAVTAVIQRDVEALGRRVLGLVAK